MRRGGCALICLLSSLACTPSPPTGVLLINIDTLRADHLGVYGYDADDISPNLDTFAEDSVLFETALAPAPWTLPSVATLFTSLYPTVHGASLTSNAMKLRTAGFRPTSKLNEDFDTLPEILSRAGFATAAFVRGAYPSPIFGFGQGFDHFEDNESHGTRFSVERLLGWLDEQQPERFFLYLHTVEVHSPYTPVHIRARERERLTEQQRAELLPAAEEERERYDSFDPDVDYQGEVDGTLGNIRELRRSGRKVSAAERGRLVQLYDRSIRYTDYWMGRLFEALEERGLLDSTIVVFTSDHGEEFWEHGGLEHGHSYFDELLRVPLIMRIPGEGGGVRVQQQVGLIDVLPTLLDVLGLETSTFVQGRSLRPLWRGESLPAQPYFGESLDGPRASAIRTERWKLIESSQSGLRLFDLEADPSERRDVCVTNRDTCLQLARQLRQRNQAMDRKRAELQISDAPRAEPDADTLERLKALGYVE